jgi:ABC-type Zn2+ transport system substrate-binding protein/surface adhesin
MDCVGVTSHHIASSHSTASSRKRKGSGFWYLENQLTKSNHHDHEDNDDEDEDEDHHDTLAVECRRGPNGFYPNFSGVGQRGNQTTSRRFTRRGRLIITGT